MLDELPDELLVEILEYVDPLTIARVARVSRNLYRVSKDHILWRKHLENLRLSVLLEECPAPSHPEEEVETLMATYGRVVMARRRAWYYGKVRAGGLRPAWYADETGEHASLSHSGFINLARTGVLGEVSDVVVSGRNVVVAGSGSLFAFDVDEQQGETHATDEAGARIKVHYSDIHSMVALPHSDLVLTGGGDGRVCLSNVRSKTRMWATDLEENDWIRRVGDVGGGSGMAMASSRSQNLYLLDLESGACLQDGSLRSLGQTKASQAMAWSICGHLGRSLVATGHTSGAVCVWDARMALGEGPALIWSAAASDLVACMCTGERDTFTPSESLFAGSYDGSVSMLDMRVESGPVRVNKAHNAPITQIEINDRERSLFSGSADGVCLSWDFEADSLGVVFSRSHDASMAFASGSAQAAEASASAMLEGGSRRFPFRFATIPDAGVVALSSQSGTALDMCSAETGLRLYGLDPGGAFSRYTLPAADADVVVAVSGQFVVAYDVVRLLRKSLDVDDLLV